MTTRRGRSLGVDWYVPGRKRPVATSTKATSDLITLHRDLTIAQARQAVRWDTDAQHVLDVLAKHHGPNRTLAEIGVAQ